MVSKTLFTRVHHTEIQKAHWLDHCFQTITFATDTHNYDVDVRITILCMGLKATF